MCSRKCLIFSMVLNFLDVTNSLIELPSSEKSEILKSEAIIRHTFNSLFHNLKLKPIKEHTKLKEYATIHKYFTSLVLQNSENMDQIARLVRANYKNINKTEDFMETINNWFTFDQSVEKFESKVNDNDESVTAYISFFLKVLKKFKDYYSIDKVSVNINTEILNLLKAEKSKSVNDSLNLYNSNENIFFAENEFWEPSGRRVFKGKRTKIKHFPFMASIQMFNNFHCSGSIIKSDLIVTASSCLQLAWNNRLFRENPAFLSTRIGSSFYNGGGEVIPVLEIYFHPDYNPKNLRNNICVLRLSRHLKFRRNSKAIKKIDIDRQLSNLPVTTPGITILGWGAKEHSPVISNPWRNILSFAVLDVYPLEDCRDIYSKEYVTKKNFCGGFLSKGGGACNHDVGGPGVVNGKLMGVISFGSPVCGAPNAPTVFTKLGYYSDWIEEIMEMDVPVSKKRTTIKPLFGPFTAPPSNTSPKPTTFKIPPLVGGEMTPIPISVIDNQLRIFDENVFKDFINTMFNSKEVPEYQDDLKEVDYSKELKNATDVYRTEYNEAITTISMTDFEGIAEPRTKIIDVSLEESAKISKHTVTVLSRENEAVDQSFDKEIEKLIDNVNLEKIVKEEVLVAPKVDEDKNDILDIKNSNSHKHKNESVLTLLYLTDDEKRDNIKITANNERVEANEGMSIPIDNFEDLTRVKENVVRVLPERELYGLLSEVIGQELHNINISSYHVFNTLIYLGPYK